MLTESDTRRAKGTDRRISAATKHLKERSMNKSKINALIEKARAGKQITAEELENLTAQRDPNSRPATVCSPRHAVAKA